MRVRRGLPDFLNSVNLKYVKLGYGYLMNRCFYVLTAPLILILGTQIGKNIWDDDFYFKSDHIIVVNALSIIGLLTLLLYIHLDLKPRSTYLIDFVCYRPPDELKVYVTCLFYKDILVLPKQIFHKFS